MIAVGALDEHITSDNGGTALDGSRDDSAQGADDEDDGGFGVHVDVCEAVMKI
jgi:hypothetical protein